MFASLSGLTALVVDDDPFSLAVTSAALKAAGLDTVIARRDVHGAQELIESRAAISVIVCDLSMPDIDGIQFLRWLAERDCKVPIILLSGVDERLLHSAEHLAIQYQLHVLGRTSKPPSPGDFQRLLLRVNRRVGQPNDESLDPDFPQPDVSAALESKIMLHYQPKVSLEDGSVVGFEGLLRWRPELNIGFSPFSFVRAAESSVLIARLTMKICELAARDMSRWSEQGAYPKVSLNMSALNLEEVDIPERMAAVFDKSNVDAGRLMFELTETSVLRYLGVSLDVLTRLRLMGIALSLDDFGTGYASLEKLILMPFNEVKLDRSFIVGARHSEDTLIVLKAAVEMAHQLKLSVVAEGVETGDDLRKAISAGCDIAQGFLFSPAVPPQDVPGMTRFRLDSYE